MTIDQLLDLPEEDLAWQFMAALEAANHEYEPWARLIGLTPGTTETDEAFEVTHTVYTSTWSRLGDLFHVKLQPITDEWRDRATRRPRTGLASRLTRAFARAS